MSTALASAARRLLALSSWCLVLLLAACATTTDTSGTRADLATDPTVSETEEGYTLLSTDRYLTVDGLDMPMDAYVPDGPGPWPIVVSFHGRSSAYKDAESNTVIAERAAADGSLVFAPTWIAGDPIPLEASDVVDLRYAASCAVAFAQQWATELGGDPNSTVTSGFSAGAGPALSAMVAPTADVPECATAAAPLPVAGAVLGDGEYFFQSQAFDTAFDDDLDAMQSEVADLSDPAGWPSDLDARVFVWAAQDGTAPRLLDDPAAPDWIDDRDPGGSIRSDLDWLGLLDDAVVDYVDNARFIELRLRESGFDTQLEVFPGGHSVDDKVEQLVAALRSVGAAGEP